MHPATRAFRGPGARAARALQARKCTPAMQATFAPRRPPRTSPPAPSQTPAPLAHTARARSAPPFSAQREPGALPPGSPRPLAQASARRAFFAWRAPPLPRRTSALRASLATRLALAPLPALDCVRLATGAQLAAPPAPRMLVPRAPLAARRGSQAAPAAACAQEATTAPLHPPARSNLHARLASMAQ